jgi:hypothetical protein
LYVVQEMDAMEHGLTKMSRDGVSSRLEAEARDEPWRFAAASSAFEKVANGKSAVQ